LAEWVFVWTGGAVFVISLVFCAVSYVERWSVVAGGGWPAVLVDGLLLGVFAAHHSVFAREPVKRWLARRVPDHLLRSVYVWIASLLFLGACAAWRPIGHQLFHVSGAQAWLHAAVQLLGVSIIALVVRDLDPLELAGIRQGAVDSRQSSVDSPQSPVDGPKSPVDGSRSAGNRPGTDDQRLSTNDRRLPTDDYRLSMNDSRLTTDGPYRLVRHPLYFGWTLIVFGAAQMTGDRLAFAALTTAYLVIAIPWEERSLVRTYGDEYRRYRRVVRWRMIPFIY
jgi:protein-S-isoprenylcysteine O-methyltransferase Ste14